MVTTELEAPPLIHGDRLSREEFLRRWELNPRIKKAYDPGNLFQFQQSIPPAK